LSKSNKEIQIDDESEDLSSIYKKKIPFTLKFFIKDIELSRRDFGLYFLMFSSLLFLLFGQFVIEQFIIDITATEFIVYTYTIIGLFIGLIASIIFNDRIKNPLKTIYYIIILSISTSAIQGLLIFFMIIPLLRFLLVVNTSITFMGTMLYFKLFLIKTTILERGRIWAYFLVLIFIEIMIFVCTMLFIFLAIIPAILFIVGVVLLKLNLEKGAIILPKSTTKRKGLQSNKDLIIYLLFYICFGLTAGFATPGERFSAVADQAASGDIILIMFIMFAGIIAVILMGIIFDFAGRTSTLSFILFTIALATYSNLFILQYQFLSDGLIFVSSIAGFMSVILIVGDIATRENLSKLISIFYIFYGAGLLIGILLRTMIKILITDVYFSNLLIMGTTFIACIICYIFLVNIRETLPRKEQAWKDFLIHLYISLASGILLFEKPYKKEDLKIPPEIISGGIVGMKTVLEKISRGEKLVSTIDHGDRVIILKTSAITQVIFTLVVREELIVLRKKIDSLIEEFDKKFFDKTQEASTKGVVTAEFKELYKIARKYFGE